MVEEKQETQIMGFSCSLELFEDSGVSSKEALDGMEKSISDPDFIGLEKTAHVGAGFGNGKKLNDSTIQDNVANTHAHRYTPFWQGT